MDPNSEADWTRNLLIHAGWVRNLAQRLVADSSIADDVVQQTWLAALTRRPSARYPDAQLPGQKSHAAAEVSPAQSVSVTPQPQSQSPSPHQSVLQVQLPGGPLEPS
jgi:hypothetical protein